MSQKKVQSSFLKWLLIILGTFFVAIGVIGIFVPLLPTTVFLLLAAACYIRSSERFYYWLINHRWLGTYIRNYREGKGIPLKTKIFTISILWLTITLSAIFAVKSLIVRVILFIIA
ncbi:YbaN family protein, partial [Fervidobacterium sp.]